MSRRVRSGAELSLLVVRTDVDDKAGDDTGFSSKSSSLEMLILLLFEVRSVCVSSELGSKIDI